MYCKLSQEEKMNSNILRQIIFVFFIVFLLTGISYQSFAANIGHDYEQQTPPAEGVDRPRVRIEYADEIYVGETTDLTAYEDIDPSGSPFFYWYADKGSFTKHDSYPDYDMVKYTAPSEPGTVWITAQVGDSLGYVGRQTIALNILPNPDDPGTGSGDCTSTLTSAEQLFDRSISYRLQLEQSAGGTQTGHFYLQPTSGDFTWYDSGAVRILINGTAVNLYTDSNLQNNKGKIISYSKGGGKLSFWINADFEQDAEIYIEQEEYSAAGTWYPGPWNVDVTCSGTGGSGTPDLTVDSAETDPLRLGPGASTFTRARVSNIGDGPADASALACYLSTNNTWDAADTLMYRHQFTNIIINGGNAFVEQNVTIPVDLNSGDYYLIFRADDQSVVTEKNEGNNVAAIPVEVRTVTGADLTVSNTGVSPTNVTPGQAVTLSARVTNSGGTGTQASSRIGYYLSADANWDSADTPLGGSYFGYLQPGQSQDFTRTFTLWSLSAGQQYIIFYADYANNITEVSKDNNKIAVSIQNTEDFPTANDDAVVTEEDVAMLIAVLENDSPPTGESLEVIDVGTPSNGAALINGDDTVTYIPNFAFIGSDSFTYTVRSTPGGTTASATVYVTVNETISCTPWQLPPDVQALARDEAGNVFAVGSFQDSITLGAEVPVTLTAPAATYALYIAKYTPSGTLLWAQKAVSTESGSIHCKAAVDATGNLYIGGLYYHSIAFYKGGTIDTSLSSPYTTSQGRDIFLAKYSPQGDPLWVEQAAGPWDDQGIALSVDSTIDRVYLAGIFDGMLNLGSGTSATTLTTNDTYDPFFAQYTQDGTLIWATQIDGGSGAINSITTGNSNAALATGYYYNTITFRGASPLTLTGGSSGSNYFVAEFNPDNGDIRWAQKGTGSCKGRAVVSDNVGQIYVAGDFSQPCDFYDANTVFRTLTSFGSNDMFMIKYQADGTPEWLHQGGGTSYDFGKDVTFDQDSNPMFIGTCDRFPVEFTIDGAGTTAASSTSCAASYDLNGNFIDFVDPGNNLVIAQQSDGKSAIIGSENIVTPCE